MSDQQGRGVSRRGFFSVGAGAVAAVGLSSALPAGAVSQSLALSGEGLAGPGDVSLGLDPGTKSSWTVARTAFGQFYEVNGRKAFPGIIDQHLSNGSFEQWWVKGNNPPWYQITTVLYEDIELVPGVAYPWEAVPAGAAAASTDGVAFELPAGGVHGRRVDGESPRFQRVRVEDAVGGVRQRLALPDERTLDYNLGLSVRGTGVEALAIEVQDRDGSVVAEASLAITGQWVRHEVQLLLTGLSSSRYLSRHGTHTNYGEFALVLSVRGTGHVDLDWATLMAGDAVAGRFNPTTLKWFRDSGVSSMRWPGGNYTSLYHWEDGIGPWQDRAVTKNLVWGGLDYHYLGIAEYLQFCELAGMEPYINLGFNTPSGKGEDIPPEEAARAVEYCNGDLSTPMGALRAEHGHPKAWNVKQWQVGNEVWGPLQNGGTDAATYAHEFKAYYDAMKAVDPTIRVYASGSDVWHLRLGDPPGTPPQWNTIFMDIAGPDYTDGLDIHNYVNGFGKKDRDKRADFMTEHGLDPIDFNQLLVGYPTGEDRAITLLREQARERGVENLQLTYGEFNANSLGGRDWPVVHWETVANSAFVAGMYNTFIRQGDAVRYSHLVDYTIFDRASTEDLWPLSPAHDVRQMYTEPFAIAGLAWHNAPVTISGPTFDIPDTRDRMMPTAGVPIVDAACLMADNEQIAFVFAVNRDLRQQRKVTLSLAGRGSTGGRGVGASALMLSSVPEHDPFAQEHSFDARTASQIRDFHVAPDANGSITVELPPAAVLRLRLNALGA